MRCASLKKSIVRSRRCCTRRPKSLTPLSTYKNHVGSIGCNVQRTSAVTYLRIGNLQLQTSHRQPLRGYLYIASAAFLWGVAANLGRAAFTGRLLPQGQTLRPIDPLILSQSRTTFSFVVLLFALLVA